MDIDTVPVSNNDQNRKSCFSIYDNVTAMMTAEPDPSSGGGGHDDTDMTSSCSEDDNTAASSTSTPNSAAALQVIRIPTGLGKEPETKQDDDNSCEVRLTPTIVVDDAVEGASQRLLRQKSAEVDDAEEGGAMVRVRLPGNCEVGSEFKGTVMMMTPVADLLSECTDLTAAQVEAVPLDQQFYNQ